jgi:hypothetical protein
MSAGSQPIAILGGKNVAVLGAPRQTSSTKSIYRIRDEIIQLFKPAVLPVTELSTFLQLQSTCEVGYCGTVVPSAPLLVLCARGSEERTD